MNGMTSERSPADQLLDLALFHGERFVGGGNRPIRLTDPDTLWLVVRGSVDVFAARLGECDVPTDLKHMLQAGPGQLLFPAPEDIGLSVLVAKGLPESELRRLPLSILAEDGIDAEIIEQINFWVSEFSESIVRDVTYRPRLERSIAPGAEEEADAGATVSAQHGVVWASSEDGDLLYLGTEDMDPSGSGLVPVTAFSWVVQGRAASVKGVSTADLHREGRLVSSLMEFNRLAMRADLTNRALLLADVSNLQVASALHRQRSEEQARLNLFSVLGDDLSQAGDGSFLLRALERIGRQEGIAFRIPQRARYDASYDEESALEDILNASGVRSRRIALRSRHRWWLSDSGAMLAKLKEDSTPVALIPGAAGRYRMVNPKSGNSMPVTAQRAATLDRTAHLFYRPLPNEPSIKSASLLPLSLNRVWGDLARLLGAGLLSGLASLAPAVLLGVFATHVLPSGDLGMLATVTLAMAMIGLNFALLEMLKGTAMMRLEARAAARVSAALWDRLLVLPSGFFRRFTAGDLGTRAMGFQHLRDQVAGIAGGALLSLVFLLPTFGPDVPLRYGAGLAGPGPGNRFSGCDSVLGPTAVAAPSPALRYFTAPDRCAAPADRWSSQAPLVRSRRLGVRYVGGQLPTAEEDRDAVGCSERASGGVHLGGAVLRDGRSARGCSASHGRRTDDWRLPGDICRVHDLLRRGDPVRVFILCRRHHPAHRRAGATHTG